MTSKVLGKKVQTGEERVASIPLAEAVLEKGSTFVAKGEIQDTQVAKDMFGRITLRIKTAKKTFKFSMQQATEGEVEGFASGMSS